MIVCHCALAGTSACTGCLNNKEYYYEYIDFNSTTDKTYKKVVRKRKSIIKLQNRTGTNAI